jgi:nucleoside-diphosphate-sugar epimerase
VVNKMVYDATFGKKITARGNAARPIVHVEDVARAIVHFVGGTVTGVFNIVGENVTISPLADRVAAAVEAEYGTHVSVLHEDAGDDQRDYAALADKARLAGFIPDYMLDDALADLVLHTATLPEGRLYERLPIARKHLEKLPA